MKSKDRVHRCYKEGSNAWKAQYDMLLEDGVTCGDCAHCRRCCTLFGQKETDDRCQFYPSRFYRVMEEDGNGIRTRD